MTEMPQDVWVCCGCDGANLIPLTDGHCPVCGHVLCLGCQVSAVASAFNLLTDSLPLAGGAFASSSPSSSSGRLPASPPHEHHINGFNNATIITNTVEDVWTCCQCGSANLTINSPECCPVCEHFKDDNCT